MQGATGSTRSCWALGIGFSKRCRAADGRDVVGEYHTKPDGLANIDEKPMSGMAPEAVAGN